jgi:hypothetical protein
MFLVLLAQQEKDEKAAKEMKDKADREAARHR